MRRLVVLVACATLAAIPRSFPPASAAGCSWTQVPVDPNVTLRGVTAASEDHVWAVGFRVGHRGVIERWDGARWDGARWIENDVPRKTFALYAAASPGPDDAWAFGWDTDLMPLALHWDGRAWTDGRAQPKGSRGVLITGSASGADDVWAGGYAEVGSRDRALIERWDGGTWSVLPAPASWYFIAGISASSPTNVWAVVDTEDRGEGGNVLARWDGTRWHQRFQTDSTIEAVAARNRREAWAVGYDPAGQAVILHWNDHRWTQVPSAQGRELLRAVAVSAPRNAWAVGNLYGSRRPFYERWRGKRWRRSPPAARVESWNAVAIVPGTPIVWAVGENVTERFC